MTMNTVTQSGFRRAEETYGSSQHSLPMSGRAKKKLVLCSLRK